MSLGTSNISSVNKYLHSLGIENRKSKRRLSRASPHYKKYNQNSNRSIIRNIKIIL